MIDTGDWLVSGAALLAAISGLVAAIFSLYAEIKNGASDKDKQSIRLGDESNDPYEETRISEVRSELSKQEFRSKWNGFASTALRISQYIIGGVLASSFIQESIDSKVIGVLGVIVLLSSLVNQHFKPDVRHRGSRQRVVQLKSLLRHAEDDKYAIEKNVDGACTVYDIRKRVSHGLNQIEEMELLDMMPHENERVDS